MDKKTIILCAGLQSSGTTIISWCFLQRPDTDGVLDMENSVIETDLGRIDTPYIWIKMTIGSFRWGDVAEIYKDLGYEVKPLLVTRDVRDVYASLITKEYGKNGTTAEDPPLRMRFRRFREDWNRFIENGWPILKYEDFVENGPDTLKKCVDELDIQWTDHMVYWNKNIDELAFPSVGNETFHKSLGNKTKLEDVLIRTGNSSTSNISHHEIAWLDLEFKEYNHRSDYQVISGSRTYSDRLETAPKFNVTRRRKWNNNWARVERLTSRIKGLQSYRKFYNRVMNHPVLGRVLRFWSKYINPSIKME